MFKNLIVYRIAPTWQPDPKALEEALLAECFVPCSATQESALGWVAPRGEDGAPLLEQVDHHWLLCLRHERRVLPGAVLRRHVEDMAQRIEQESGRKPGKKQLRDLKEQAQHELLPRCFTTQGHQRVWIAPRLGLLMVDAGSISKADGVISLLTKADSTLQLHLVQSAESPASCMAAWLMDGVPPEHFTIDRECELKASDEMKATVRYARHNLDIDEVRTHLTSGKLPTRLALTWRERVSLTLTDTLQIKKISFLDVVFEGRDKPAKDEAFDVDAALATGELARLIPDLIQGLGGELDFAQAALEGTHPALPQATPPAATTASTASAAAGNEPPPWE
ncbi:recombination-associated protein RdgC [Roseateles sp. BYS180W]|uniref:Recombination-associated protein RdgC n=1 Tax=Roseateles rivi TaxID=3299028 RepID=A0ABW7FZB0_9BURK